MTPPSLPPRIIPGTIGKVLPEDEAEVPAPLPSAIGGTDEAVNWQDQSVKFKFKRLKERKPGEAWILLVYGASKTGKTYFAGTAGPRTLFINIGEGIETLMAPAFTRRFPQAKEMIVVDVREAQGIAEAFDLTCDAIDHALTNFPDQFDTVILDEATAFRKFGLNKAMDLNTGTRTKATRPNRNQEYVKADIGDFGIEMDMVNWFLGEYIPRLKGAGKNFLMLAHQRQIFAKAGKVGDDPVLKRIIPGFTGKTFPDQVPAFFDDVWHSEVVVNGMGNAAYLMRTAGNDSELAGTRHGGIFRMTEEDPNYLDLLARIKLAQPITKK